MHIDRELVEQRITRDLRERIPGLVHTAAKPLTVTAGPSRDDQSPFAVGSPWGAPWETTWFTLTGTVPADWSGQRVEAIVDLGFEADAPGFQCEGLVRAADGTPLQGVHPRRTAVAVPSGGEIALTIEAASNPSFHGGFRPSPLGRVETAGDTALYTLRRADLVVVDPDGESLLHDLDVLDGVMRALDLRDPRRPRLLATIAKALDVVAAGDGAKAAAAVLSDALDARAAPRTHRVVATGHAHIDTAWLWPLRETRRKCVRTFASAVALMDADPEYRFVCSQAQQYEWIRADEPALFERIAAHVAGGQWLPIGGMWVESDMNLPSGESIARQIVHGQRYFDEQFGLRCTEMWIPDVFGYPATLPQIFAAGGMRRFVTQKMSWNQTNRFPHHTFWWEGLDGTRVLTHFPPVDTYGAEITPAELARSVDKFAEHAWSNRSLVPFGYGDGGGGPTREMLARARRLADLDGMPRVGIGSPAEFFSDVEDEARADPAAAPVWRGELYFETHRGTLTSQLRTKLGNKRCERLLREVELLTAAAAVDGAEVDPRALDEQWRDVLTQQFHDIIPGSSIGWVHDDAETVLDRVAGELEDRIAASLAPYGDVVVNTATWPRREVVLAAGDDVEGVAAADDDQVQRLDDGQVALVVAAPALGVAPLAAPELESSAPGRRPDRVVVTDRSMSNEHVAVSWDSGGRLSSLIDVARGRELLAAPAGVLELAADQPVRYDAWDVESWTVDAGEPVGAPDRVEVVADGPLVGIVAVDRRFGPSAVAVRYVLRAGSPRLDIEVDIDWQHREHLLSMVFPLDVHTDTATCGVQFGSVRRPTHRSTTWDAAKFEVCAHRYVDVAEPDFGVAVLNDGRWGHGVHARDAGGSTVRVSLARGARFPDPDADIGRHAVTLALYPHGPGLADVVAEAERLDLPLRIHRAASRDAGAEPQRPAPPVTVAGEGVEVDAVKLADDGSGDLVIRLHEAIGNRTLVTLAGARPVTAAAECNLLEEPESTLDVADGIVTLQLRPFKLATVRLTT